MIRKLRFVYVVARLKTIVDYENVQKIWHYKMRTGHYVNETGE